MHSWELKGEQNKTTCLRRLLIDEIHVSVGRILVQTPLASTIGAACKLTWIVDQPRGCILKCTPMLGVPQQIIAVTIA